jgi:preprotein translocase subunit YajC
MPGSFAAVPLLFAENAPAADGGGAASPFSFPIILLIIVFWFYLLMIRPQQKQEQKRKEMIAALKKNDKVLTSGGIYGTVVSVDNDSDRVMVRVDDDKGVRMAFSKTAIARVLEAAAEKEKAAESA